MKLKYSIVVLAGLGLILNACGSTNPKSVSQTPDDPLNFVDPYIGSAGHGHVFVGASVPWGGVQVGPTNINQSWDWCSGYNYSDSIVRGFSQLHLSGTGIGDLGDVLMMPYLGKIRTQVGTQLDPSSGYSDKYSHDYEKVSPAFYQVRLLNSHIEVSLSASERVAFHKYLFPGTDTARVIIDLEQGIGWDAPVKTYLRKINDTTIVGYRFSKGWAENQQLWFAIKTSKPFNEFNLFDDTKWVSGDSLTSIKTKAVLSFGKLLGDVEFKVGISPISSENALANIQAEIPSWDFDKVVENANDKWRTALSKIQVETNDTARKRVFYTAMYHSMIDPILYNDHDGSYRGTDKKVYSKASFNNYTVFSLWDTYRALNPLLTVMHPELVNDFVNSMLAIYQQQGKLPVWPLMGNETNCMVGYSAVPVIADAILKGFKGFDVNLALEAMKSTANKDEFGLKYLKSLGYIPADKEVESVSKALEYAVDDGCIAATAKYLNKLEDYNVYKKRSTYYKRYFDTKTQFMRGVLSNGQFHTPFDPFQSIHRENDYTEGNAWQYIWLVPQDVPGLIELFGSDSAFVNKLDSLFIVKGNLGKNASPDISGLIGMYAHGNEPEHHVPYLYAYAGQQWKVAEKVNEIAQKFYTDKPDGLCGNDDCGEMSGWYVMSSLGFYQVNPAGGIFIFGTPLYDNATIDVGNHKSFMIIANHRSDKNIYIQSVKLNNENYDKVYISYQDIMKGGVLEFTMGAKPNKHFGAGLESRPL